jgi:hypothetical protein
LLPLFAILPVANDLFADQGFRPWSAFILSSHDAGMDATRDLAKELTELSRRLEQLASDAVSINERIAALNELAKHLQQQNQNAKRLSTSLVPQSLGGRG